MDNILGVLKRVLTLNAAVVLLKPSSTGDNEHGGKSHCDVQYETIPHQTAKWKQVLMISAWLMKSYFNCSCPP